jgi:hypothetical protein
MLWWNGPGTPAEQSAWEWLKREGHDNQSPDDEREDGICMNNFSPFNKRGCGVNAFPRQGLEASHPNERIL